MREREKPMGMFFDRRCPYCNAIISDSANKCRFCGEWLISENEKKQLDKSIQENKKFEEQMTGFLGLCVIIVLIVLAISCAIDGIKNTFFNTSEAGSVQENVIEQKGDLIDMSEEDYNRIVRESERQKQNSELQQSSTLQKSQSQPVVQHIKQSTPAQIKPQVRPVEASQNNQDIDDFMN